MGNKHLKRASKSLVVSEMRIKIATKYHCIVIKFPSNWEKPTVAATSRQDENRVVPAPGGMCGHRPSGRQRGGSPGKCQHTLTAAALLLGPSPRGQQLGPGRTDVHAADYRTVGTTPWTL